MPDKKEKRDTVLRQWEMLRQLPKAPAPPITVQQMQERLEEAGYPVDARTVQRDLKALASVFVIDVIDRSPPFGWRWSREAPFEIPSIPLAEALALELVQQHLKPLLPTAQLDSLRGLFRASRQKLDALSEDNPMSRWASRVRVVPAHQALLAPPVNPDIQAVIYEALLKRLQVRVNYRNVKGELKEGMPLHLMAIVQRGPITFLIARARDYDDVRLFDLHRVEAAKLLTNPVRETAGFDLDEYLASGALDFTQTGMAIRLELRLLDKQAKYLSETPVSQDQVITPDEKPGWTKLTATVNDTAQLRWWLRSMGDRCEVLAPSSIRDSFVQLAQQMSKLYQI